MTQLVPKRIDEIELIDFPGGLPRSLNTIPLFAVMGGFGVIAVLIAYYERSNAVFPALIALVAVGAFASLFFMWRLEKAAKRSLFDESRCPSNLCRQVEFVLSRRLFADRLDLLTELLAFWAKREHAPCIIRLWPNADLQPPDPLDTPLEPRPLGEASNIFKDSYSTTDVHNPQKQARPAAKRLPIRQRIARLLFAILGLTYLIAGAGHSERIAIAAVISFSAASILMQRNIAVPAFWLLAPAALLLRTRKKSSTTVHIFDARHSLLCLYNIRPDEWGFIVADATHCESASATKGELDILLRAWFSPLPAPSAEHIDDLIIK